MQISNYIDALINNVNNTRFWKFNYSRFTSVRTPLVRLEIRIIIIDHMSTIRNNENSLNKTKNHTIKEYYYT
jgi:hypothetical protein